MSEEEPRSMSDKLMTIREMCDAFSVTPRTLRFYETRELLFPSAAASIGCMIAGTGRG